MDLYTALVVEIEEKGESVRLFMLAVLLAASGTVTLINQQTQQTQNQPTPTGGQEGILPQPADQNTPAAQRAASTRAFLGLGAVPDKAAAARGEPTYTRTCAFCHGPSARGGTALSLITSDIVLADDHGEHLLPFLKRGVPEKGMPGFASMTDEELTDVSEYLHLQVEDVANRGAYQVLNILVGDAAKGKAYVEVHCMSCHKADAFEHYASRFRSPDQLQRNWIWPARDVKVTATVKSASGAISGTVTRIDDFRITLVDATGKTVTVDRKPGTHLDITDPLAPHQEFLMKLGNDDMHNVTAYLETLK